MLTIYGDIVLKERQCQNWFAEIRFEIVRSRSLLKKRNENYSFLTLAMKINYNNIKQKEYWSKPD